MKYISTFILILLLVGCGPKDSKDPIDEYDRFDLANTIDTTKGKYNPRIDSTYIFPLDSSDIATVTEFSDYKIKTTIFPVRNKYVIAFHETASRKEKIKYRDYKLQVEISDHEGLYIKRVITKYDFPDSILRPKPNNYFIRDVKFKGLENDEFRFDIKVCFYDEDKPAAMIKYFVHLVDGLRFEDYPKIYYDSLNPEQDEL
jgi:hypothetical protein